MIFTVRSAWDAFEKHFAPFYLLKQQAAYNAAVITE
jgi:hypothetical protein